MPSTTNKLTRRIVALCAVLMMLASSCGGDDDSASQVDPTAVPTTEPVSAPTPEPTATAPPTAEPTATSEPTTAPTATTEPTAAPTATTGPTAIPTATAVPTVAPTATAEPTTTATPSPTPAPGPITGSYDIDVGEEFVISFVLPAGSSVRWELTATPNPSVVTLVDETYFPPSGGTDARPGTQYFTLRGVDDGLATVHFWLLDPNADTITPLQLASFDITVGTGVPGCDGIFHVDSGEEFEVLLGMDATDGYEWELAEAPTPGVVQLVAEEFPTTDTHRFRFRGITDGETALKFRYVRPFDNPPVPLDFAQFEAIVGTGIPGCSGVFDIAIGEEFQIAIESNATTGYTWELREPVTAGVLTLVREEYIAAATDAVGASGWQRFTFRGVGDGQSDIRLWYIRSFDNPAVSADTAFFKAIVGDGVP